MRAAISIPVRLKDRSYQIILGKPNSLKQLPTFSFLRESKGGIFIIADPRIKKLILPLQKKLKHRCLGTYWLKGGESSKQISSLQKIYQKAAQLKLDRHCIIIAAGGGVVGDVAGFFAATYLRGLKVIHLPTTVIAQVDSAIGGKTGVNLPEGKNLVGAFHQPSLVYIDPATLRTLPDREFRSGLAEVIKYGVISDRPLFERLEERLSKTLARDPSELRWILERCCAIKARVVSRDEREITGLRAILNFGHTIGHGIEAAAHYRLLHGEAIAIGMVGACLLSEKRTGFSKPHSLRVRSLIQKTGLPTQLPSFVSHSQILAAMKLDKKAAFGKIRFVLASKIGKVKTGIEISEKEIQETLCQLDR